MIQYLEEIVEVVVFANINCPVTQILNLREFFDGGIQENIVHGIRTFFIIRMNPSEELNSILTKVEKTVVTKTLLSAESWQALS